MKGANIDLNLVKKYLNCPTCDDEFLRLFECVKKEVVAVAQPKKLCVLCEASCKKGYYYLEKLNLTLKSEDINKLFDSCDKVAVFVVTLGAMVDKKIAFYSNCDVMRATMFDAVASVYVENILDDLQEEFLNKYPEKYHTMRFSAGYGDLPLCLQKSIIESTEANKFLGISVGDNFIMTPSKSITAFVGLSNKKQVKASICLTCARREVCDKKCFKIED